MFFHPETHIKKNEIICKIHYIKTEKINCLVKGHFKKVGTGVYRATNTVSVLKAKSSHCYLLHDFSWAQFFLFF